MAENKDLRFTIQKYPELLALSIWEFPCCRKINACGRRAIDEILGESTTIGEFLQLDPEELRKCPHVGSKTIQKVQAAVAAIGRMGRSDCEDMIKKRKEQDEFLEEMIKPMDTTSARCDAITDVIDDYIVFCTSKDYRDAFKHLDSIRKFSGGMSSLIIFLTWLKYRESLPKADKE